MVRAAYERLAFVVGYVAEGDEDIHFLNHVREFLLRLLAGELADGSGSAHC